MKNRRKADAELDQADRYDLYLAPGVITVGSKVYSTMEGDSSGLANQKQETKSKPKKAKAGKGQTPKVVKQKGNVKASKKTVNQQIDTAEKPQTKQPKIKQPKMNQPQAKISASPPKEKKQTVVSDIDVPKKKLSKNKPKSSSKKANKAKKSKNNYLPLGEGFKVLLSVGDDFSLQGTLVTVFQDTKLVAQKEMNEDGVVVFHDIPTPLERPVRVIVQFPQEQNLEDLHFSVDAGDTGLSAQV